MIKKTYSNTAETDASPSEEPSEPPPSSETSQPQSLGENPSTYVNGNGTNGHKDAGLISWLKSALQKKNDDALRKTLEEYVDENGEINEHLPAAIHEKKLISNVLKVRDLRAMDIMVPRADIIAIDVENDRDSILKLISEHPHSRFPVYKDELDNIIGSLHIKDMVLALPENSNLNIESIVRDMPIVSPTIPVLDLLLEMRETRRHMALVIDEFGGVDGLITIGDLIETIVGEFYDEHDIEVAPEVRILSDGSVIADARVDVEEFEKEFGELLSEEERDEVDTLGGLVFTIARRVPARGEVLRHESGMVFEIIEADPRRVSKMRIRNIPQE